MSFVRLGGFAFLIMNKKIVRISSRLYFDLFQRGGDKLIAVYCTIKSSREFDKYYSYTSKNNKILCGYSLLRAKTTLTLHVIKSYVPILIDMGLCSIIDNGDFYILGGEKIKELYDSKKLVPILIGSNLNNTADNVMSVRLHAEHNEQQRQINKKQYRSELLKQASNPTNYKLFKKAQRLLKKLGEEKITIVDTVVLSNQGYALLKNGSEDKKSMGGYWKSKLVKKGIITSERRFKKLQKMTYSEYLTYKSFYSNNKAVFKNGFLCEEQIASLSPINLISSPIIQDTVKVSVEVNKQVKGLSHLSFDMVAWWKNN